jgi:hypothetical protein
MRNYMKLPLQRETKKQFYHLINSGKRLPGGGLSRIQKRYG